MADTSITAVWTTGKTVDRYIINGSGQWYTGSAFETFDASHWTTYAASLTETGSSGIYAATMPTVAAGEYLVVLRERQSGSAAISDPNIGGDCKSWDGSQFVSALVLDTTLATIQSSGPITVTLASPVALDGYVTLVKGDDYFNADGRALVWSTSNSSTWPDLTSATITFTATKNANNTNSGAATITATGAVAVASGAFKSIRVELAATATSTLAVGAMAYSYDVLATLADGHKARLALGAITVRQNQS